MTDDDRAKLIELMDGMYIAMFTTRSEDGTLQSVPMARQEVEPSGELWFISARDTRHVSDIAARPAGRADLLEQRRLGVDPRHRHRRRRQAKLEELWNTFAEAWLPGGPEDPNATLIRVDVEGGEYWDTPGGRVASLLSLAKTKLTGETYDAEHGTADL